MTTKTYSTDTSCPYCLADIYNALYQRVFSDGDGGGDFEWLCSCGNLLEIEVVPIPSFVVHKINSACFSDK